MISSRLAVKERLPGCRKSVLLPRSGPLSIRAGFGFLLWKLRSSYFWPAEKNKKTGESGGVFRGGSSIFALKAKAVCSPSPLD